MNCIRTLPKGASVGQVIAALRARWDDHRSRGLGRPFLDEVEELLDRHPAETRSLISWIAWGETIDPAERRRIIAQEQRRSEGAKPKRRRQKMTPAARRRIWEGKLTNPEIGPHIRRAMAVSEPTAAQVAYLKELEADSPSARESRWHASLAIGRALASHRRSDS